MAHKLVLDNGKQKTLRIRKGGKAIFVEKGVWHTLNNMSKDCLLLILCDQKYNEGKII